VILCHYHNVWLQINPLSLPSLFKLCYSEDWRVTSILLKWRASVLFHQHKLFETFVVLCPPPPHQVKLCWLFRQQQLYFGTKTRPQLVHTYELRTWSQNVQTILPYMMYTWKFLLICRNRLQLARQLFNCQRFTCGTEAIRKRIAIIVTLKQFLLQILTKSGKWITQWRIRFIHMF
jgi:hypothetical protein